MPSVKHLNPFAVSCSANAFALITTSCAYIPKLDVFASTKHCALAAIIFIKGPPCVPGKIALLIRLEYSWLFHSIIPPLGPRSVLCVVLDTTSANCIGLTYALPATKPA